VASGLTLRAALAAGALALVAGCGGAPASTDAEAGPTSSPSASTPPVVQADPVEAVKPEPLRAGETRRSLRIPKTYTPSAPHGVGTDDYRCFLLDPHLTRDTFLTGTFVKPDNRNVVHHVILYRADPDQVAAAKQLDAKDPGEGWTCFGDSGLPNSSDLDDAPWLGAWAPGATESVDAPGFGTPLVPAPTARRPCSGWRPAPSTSRR
jgi:hypothetical protein